MKFATFYFSALFLLFFGAAQFADHIGAKQCQERTDYVLSYNECRQLEAMTTTTRLTGDALLQYVKTNATLSKTEQCLGAGYVRDNNGPEFTQEEPCVY